MLCSGPETSAHRHPANWRIGEPIDNGFAGIASNSHFTQSSLRYVAASSRYASVLSLQRLRSRAMSEKLYLGTWEHGKRNLKPAPYSLQKALKNEHHHGLADSTSAALAAAAALLGDLSKSTCYVRVFIRIPKA